MPHSVASTKRCFSKLRTLKDTAYHSKSNGVRGSMGGQVTGLKERMDQIWSEWSMQVRSSGLLTQGLKCSKWLKHATL